MKIINTSGKRKRSVARATLRPGFGIIKLNDVELQYVEPKIVKLKLMEPCILAKDVIDKFDIDIQVFGGGYLTQADAARLAIARALVEVNPRLKEKFLEYDRQLLVADVRRKEASKPNSHGRARAKVQKSYR